MNTWYPLWLGAAVLAGVLSLSHPQTVRAQATAQLSQEKAVKEYPALTDTKSEFHKKFVERFQYLKSQSDSRIQRDDWPMMIAKEVAEELGVKSKSEKATESAAAEPAASVPAGTQMTVDGVVFQRIPEGIIVDCGSSGGSAHAKGRVFLRKGVAAEGETVHLANCVADGTYTYKDPAGAQHVLDAFLP